MTDIAGAIEKIQEEEVEYKDAQGRIYDKFGSNINQLIDDADDKGFLGEIKSSVLTEIQFQARRGSGWVLMIGQDITGSDYEVSFSVTTLEDMRGHFPRVWANDGGVDSGRSIGSAQGDATQDHRHRVIRGGTRVAALINNPDGGLQRSGVVGAGDVGTWFESSTEPSVGRTNNHGDSDGKPENYALNYFIRINI